MDIDLFRDGEQFSSFLDQPDYSNSMDFMSDINDIYEWDIDNERELNGDMAVIPMSGNFCSSISTLSESPPAKEYFNKIMSDWQQFINIGSPIETPLVQSEENDDETKQQKGSNLDEINLNDFDITDYINEPLVEERKIKAGVKKIDMEQQRYIVSPDEEKVVDEEDENVDVETVEDGENSPVLQAGDLKSLLEQFEATEMPDMKPIVVNETEKVVDSEKHVAKDVKVGKPEPEQPIKIKQEPKEENNKPSQELNKNKQILDSLPQELIARIKESSKRKPISVIEPIPNKKRNSQTIKEINRKNLKSLNESIQLDHDYCGFNHYNRIQKKDSGFESAEEDDKTLIKHQPMVKNIDGKLMVSLLKCNTIHTMNDNKNLKKKLNLEEYKKRREGFLIKSGNNSMNSSPMSSTCSSPLPEDENLRRIKHQEKLMQMAKEVLNTPPPKKSDQLPSNNQNSPVADNKTPPRVQQTTIPSNLVMKTLVSVGVNTVDINEKDLLMPLEEIKPLLQKASAKINCNSLITSMIKNIPKIINKTKKHDKELEKGNEVVKKEHGEDKTIVYLPKDRPSVKTKSVEVQTNISLLKENEESRYRRRSSSSSSSDEEKYTPHKRCRKRKYSNSSTSSRDSSSSSLYSSSSSSRSRSRSISPKPNKVVRKRRRSKDRERLREIEERRVIYVGRICSTITKDDLRKRFQRFGTITNVSLHFRKHGDNYGFVTFANKLDAYEAIEHGNDDPYAPKYDLSFGGRRVFCQTSYSDLDNMREEEVTYYPQHNNGEDSFDALLREAQEKLRKRRV